MTFRGLLLAAATLGGLVIAVDAASAASPAYCALYSREYAVDTVQPAAAPGMLQSVQDQAYFRCLNMDQDPPLPQTSAYFGAPLPSTAATTTTTTGTSSQSAGSTEVAAIVPPIPRPAPAAPPKTIVTASAPKPTVTTAATTQAPATPKATTTTTATAPTTTVGYHPSGKAQGSDEWKAYCAKWFPNSWDPETGTILRVGASSREVCR